MRTTLAPQGPPSEPRWNLDEGEPIGARRTALKRLGGGHRYDAYLAWDEDLHAIVVCKLARPHLTDDPHTLAGLAGEWEMLERLDHPVIVRGFDAVLDGPRPHIVLEHLEGPRLSTLVRRYGPLPIEQLVPLALQLCSAIHYLRGRDVVHLDVKPSNTIMGSPPRLIDLSVAMTHGGGCRARFPRRHRRLHGAGAVRPCAVAGRWARARTSGDSASPSTRPPPVSCRSASRTPAPKNGPVRWPQLAVDPRWPEGLPAELAPLVMLCLEPDPARRPEPSGPAFRAGADPRRFAEAAPVAAEAAPVEGGRCRGSG